jgi:hypothetical protein
MMHPLPYHRQAAAAAASAAVSAVSAVLPACRQPFMKSMTAVGAAAAADPAAAAWLSAVVAAKSHKTAAAEGDAVQYKFETAVAAALEVSPCTAPAA